MRFSQRLFLSVVALLTLALSVMQYAVSSMTLSQSLARERQTVYSTYQMLSYSAQLAVEQAAREGQFRPMQLQQLSAMLDQNTALLLQAGDEVLVDGRTSRVALRLSLQDYAQQQPAEIALRSFTEGGRSYLTAEGCFAILQEGVCIVMIERDITPVYEQIEALQQTCRTIYLCVLAGGVVLVGLLSHWLTRPLSVLTKVSARFAEGDYTARVHNAGKDEIGRLSQTYNQMAASIAAKIEALEQAAQRQKDFTANFAHELKTPMTSMIGYADLLYQRELTPAQVRQAAGYIVQEGMRLEALSFKLLELLTLEKQSFPLECLQTELVLQDAADTMQPAAAKNRVSLTCRAEPAWAWLEFDLLKTLLLNLMDNAIKADSRNIVLAGRKTDQGYRIIVEDDGRGMPAEVLSRITEPFYMVDKSRSRRQHGAGLGLSLAAEIARLHHTALHYESEVGRGTRVSLMLSLAEEEENAE